jgi:hypothetical protein
MYAISDPGSAYFTADRNNAIRYAKDKAASSGKMEHAADWSSVHVHQVEPTGHYEKDNLDPRQSFKTKHPLRVVGKVYLPGQPRD